MSVIKSAENKASTATRAACKILRRECNPPMEVLIKANPVPKLVKLLCYVDSKPNVWLFPLFFLITIYSSPDLKFESAWAIGLSPTLHQAYLTRPKLLWVLKFWLDSFLCYAHLKTRLASTRFIIFYKLQVHIWAPFFSVAPFPLDS